MSVLKLSVYKVREKRGTAVRAAAERRVERQPLPPPSTAESVTAQELCHVAQAEE